MAAGGAAEAADDVAALCARLSGLWEGKSVPRVSQATIWKHTFLKFSPARDDTPRVDGAGAPRTSPRTTKLTVVGHGVSVWKGKDISFDVQGVIDIASGGGRLVKQHCGEFSNRVAYNVALAGRGTGVVDGSSVATLAGVPQLLDGSGSSRMQIPDMKVDGNDREGDGHIVDGAGGSEVGALGGGEGPPRLTGRYSNGTVSLTRVADTLTGIWKGQSVGDKGEVTRWKSTKVNFAFDSDESFLGSITGRGTSTWRGIDVGFVLHGTFDWQTKEMHFTKQHKGRFTNSVVYRAILFPDVVQISGQYKNGIIELRREGDVAENGAMGGAGGAVAALPPPVSSEIEPLVGGSSPIARHREGKEASLPGDGGGGGGGAAGHYAGEGKELSDTAETDSGERKHEIAGGSKDAYLVTGAAGEARPDVAVDVLLPAARALADRISGVWEGQSDDPRGHHTVWKNTRLIVSVDPATGEGVLRGRGTSVWRNTDIPFDVSGSIDFVTLTINIVKQHTARYTNRVKARLRIRGLSELRAAFAHGDAVSAADVARVVDSLAEGLSCEGLSQRNNKVTLTRFGPLTGSDEQEARVARASAARGAMAAEHEGDDDALVRYKSFLCGLLAHGAIGPFQMEALTDWRSRSGVTEAVHSRALSELGLREDDIKLDDAVMGPDGGEDDGDLCRVCFGETIDVVLLPCGHLCICSGCAAKLRDRLCPICRAKIKRVTQVYRS